MHINSAICTNLIHLILNAQIKCVNENLKTFAEDHLKN